MIHTATLKLAPFALLSGFIFSGHAVAVENTLPKVEHFPFEISVVAPEDTKLASEQYNIKIVNKTNHKTQIIEEGKPFAGAGTADLLALRWAFRYYRSVTLSFTARGEYTLSLQSPKSNICEWNG